MLMSVFCTDLLLHGYCPILQFRGVGENTNNMAAHLFSTVDHAWNPALGDLVYLRAAGVLSS